jgi:hypothetical protein
MMNFDVGDDEPEKVRNSFKNALGGRFSRHLRRKESVVFLLRKISELRSELVGEPAKHRSGIESVKKEESPLNKKASLTHKTVFVPMSFSTPSYTLEGDKIVRKADAAGYKEEVRSPRSSAITFKSNAVSVHLRLDGGGS